MSGVLDPAPRPVALPAPGPAPAISVVIPIYNEERNIPALHARLLPVLEKIGRTFEIVYVDDGSRDTSPDMLERIAQEDRRVVVVLFARNFGQHSAVFAGFDRARGDVIVTLDADLQNPPEEIPKLVAKLEEGFDVVGGWREDRKDSLLRKAPSWVINRITNRMLGCSLNDYGCMLRAYRRPVIRRMSRYRDVSSFIPALSTRVGGRIAEVRVAHDERAEGTSKYNVFRLIRLSYDLLTGFTMFPLQLLSLIGFAFSFLGMGFGIFLFIRRLIVGPEVEGVFTLFAILFFLVGTLYMALGLIGEYVGRIYVEVRGHPRYIVDRVIRDGGIQELE